MPTLYDEAIADAKALKEMAERNARNKIIESISPQIRRMVERQMLSEQEGEEGEDTPNLDLEPLPDEPIADMAPFTITPLKSGKKVGSLLIRILINSRQYLFLLPIGLNAFL